MLRNQQFIDPSIAQQIHKLEQEMKRLIQTRVNIKNNHKISEQVKQRLLRYNDDERVRLRRLMEKGKLAMVQYLDRQVRVVSKECIMKGRVVDNSDNKPHSNQYNSAELQKSLQTTRTRQSIISGSSNCHLIQNSRLSPQTTDNSITLYQQYKSYRQNFIHSDILQVNQFNVITQNVMTPDHQQQSIQQKQQQQSKFSYGRKRKLSAYMNCEQQQDSRNDIYPQSMMMVMTARQSSSSLSSWLKQQQQQSFVEIQKLYLSKIRCLQQKCSKLQQQNIQFRKIIEYQQKTIEQITMIIDQKERHVMEVECKFRQREQIYRMKIQQLKGGFGEQVNRVCSEIQSNKEMMIQTNCNSNPINQYSQIRHYSPSIQNKPTSSFISPKSVSKQYTVENEISFLSKQLLQLQQLLKKIQLQNQQLKVERKLLLKKIKI